jgi:hypothetical protein
MTTTHMYEVLTRVLVGWTALSGLTMLGWSVLVPRYKRALNRRSAKVQPLRVRERRQAA